MSRSALTVRVARIAFIVLLAADAGAQSTPAAAVKQAKAGAKVALAEHKTRTTAAFADLQAGLEALVSGLEADQFGAPLMQTFLDSAHAFQLEVADATEEADEAIADAFSAALAGLAVAQGVPFDGAYPPGFLSGDRGAFDDAEAGLAKAVAKLYAKVGKKADAAITKARAADVGLTLQFMAPPRRGFFGPAETGSVGTFHNPVLVSLIVGASRLDVAHDGLVLVAGTVTPVGGDVSVSLFAEDAQGSSVVVLTDATPVGFPGLGGEWSLLIDDEGAGLLEGNYNLDAFLSGDLTAADGCAGVP